MVSIKGAFSAFSVDDLAQAEKFYVNILGLMVENDEMGLRIHLHGGGTTFAYPKKDHVPATFTILNFEVAAIDEAVDALVAMGVTFERYEGFNQDEKGIQRGRSVKRGPDIAWFKDPAGNIFSVLQS